MNRCALDLKTCLTNGSVVLAHEEKCCKDNNSSFLLIVVLIYSGPLVCAINFGAFVLNKGLCYLSRKECMQTKFC